MLYKIRGGYAPFFFTIFHIFDNKLKLKAMTRFILFSICIILNLSVFGQFAPYTNTTNQIKIIDTEQENNSIENNSIPENSMNVIWSEDFGTGIPATWTNVGYDGALPTSSISPNALWEYRGTMTTPGISTGSRGAYTGTTGPIQSASAHNGFIIFDSDYLDNNGVPGAGGTGLAPTPHVGTLSTGDIDLSNYPNVQLEFHSFQRRFFGDAFIAFSNDGGVTWPDSIEYHFLDVNQRTESDNYERSKISSYVGGSANARMKIIFDGATDGNTNGSGYYFWQLDDMAISEVANIDLVLSSIDMYLGNNGVNNSYFSGPNANFYDYPTTDNMRDYYGQIPLDQMDDVNYGYVVYNWGALDNNQISCTMDIENNGVSVYQNTETAGSLLADSTMIYYATGNYMPTQIGEYTCTYTVVGDSADGSPIDNTSERIFEVTDTVFNAYKPGTNHTDCIGTGHFTGGDDGFRIGNVYDLTTDKEITSVTIRLYRSNSDYYNTLPGGLIQVQVFDTTGFWSAGLENLDSNTPNAGQKLYSDFYTVTSQDTADRYVTIPIPTVDPLTGNPVNRVLPAGSYMVAVELYSNGGASPIRIYDDVNVDRYAWYSMIYVPGDQWYTNPNAPYVAANFGDWGVPSSIDENTEGINHMIYPNPTKGLCNIDLNLQNQDNVQVIFRDITGKIIIEKNFSNILGRFSNTFDLQHLENGIYFYEINVNKRKEFGKIILNK